MTGKEIFYDIAMEATNFNLGDDSRFNEENYILYLVAEARARDIRDTYKRNGVIEPIWLQDTGTIAATKVNSADDPNLVGCPSTFGKFDIPPVVSISNPMLGMNDLGIQRVSSACKAREYFPTTISKLSMIINGKAPDMFCKSKYYFRIGNSIYTYPFEKNTSAQLIQQDPLEGKVFDTLNLLAGELVVGNSYKVNSGSIVHNSVTVQAPNTFTAANTDFTGAGQVKNNPQIRTMTSDDEYPMSATQMRRIKEVIFEEFRNPARNVNDNTNDSMDEALSLDRS